MKQLIKLRKRYRKQKQENYGNKCNSNRNKQMKTIYRGEEQYKHFFQTYYYQNYKQRNQRDKDNVTIRCNISFCMSEGNSQSFISENPVNCIFSEMPKLIKQIMNYKHFYINIICGRSQQLYEGGLHIF